MIGTLSAAFLGVVGSGDPPTVFTVTLDNLSTRFAEYGGAAASIKFKLTATDGGSNPTTSSFVYLDSSQGSGTAANALDAIGDVATLIETKLNALAGYSGVTVDGVATVVGDQWDFTVTFPGALSVTGLAFHASSQWMPTITLVEAVTQQGLSAVAGVAEVVTITYDGMSDTGTTAISPDGSVDVAAGLVASVTPPTGWATTAGGGAFDAFVTFTKSATGVSELTITSGPGILTTDVEGVDEVVAQPEVQTITPTPVNPTGGTYSLVGTATLDYDHDGPSPIGDGWSSAAIGGNTRLSTGVLEYTNGGDGDVGDTSLAPVNIDLTAPEITHSIA